ncbi:hypothetical protein STENM223S_02555 [Streptomyces tendae]
MSMFDRDAGVHGDHDDRHHEDARQDELDVVRRRPGQRASEEVREHQQVHDREGRDVEQLLRHVLDLQHGAPAERQGGGQRAGPRRPLLGDQQRRQRLRADRRQFPGLRARGRAHAATSSFVSCAGAVRGAGVVAGQREEDLVEARLAEGEVVDGDACAGQLGERPCRLVGGGVAGRGVEPGGERHGVGFQLHLREQQVAQQPLGVGTALGVAQPHMDGTGAHGRLELALGALGDHPALVDHGDPGRELVGLVQVLRGQQDGGALCDDRAHDVPHLVAAARVEAGGGLVEEQQVRGVEDGRGDVDAAPHAARVLLDLLAGRLGETERLQQLGGALAGGGLAVAEQPAQQRRGSRVPVRSSSTDAYWPVRLTRERTSSASRTTS